MFSFGVYSEGDYFAFLNEYCEGVQESGNSLPADAPEILTGECPSLDERTKGPYSALILGPESRSSRIKGHLIGLGFSVVATEERLTHSFLDRLLPLDLVLSNGYAFRIADDVLQTLSTLVLNLHVTYLPWGRGIGTIFYASILDQPTGISIHTIPNSNIDDGPIIYRKKVRLDWTLTTRQVHRLLTEAAEESFIQFFTRRGASGWPETENLILPAKVKPPYFSRHNFETLIRFFPKAYDTDLCTLRSFGRICRNNMYTTSR
jgi:hypothetical protein